MLQNLRIENFAIIDQLSVDFEDGMTVLTGETGAGKSIIIDAVGLLIGGRSSADYIRYGEDYFLLTGMFFMPEIDPEAEALMANWHIPFDDQQIQILRKVERNGRNTVKVNGVSLTVTALRQLGQYIVDIHGQNEHQTLMDPKWHLSLLDRYDEKKMQPLLATYHEQYETYRDLKQLLNQLTLNDKETAQRMDLLKFQIDDIEKEQLEVGEEDRLVNERTQLKNYERVVQSLTTANNMLTQSAGSAYDALGEATTALSDIETLDSQYQKFYQQAESIYYGIEGLSSDISHALDELSYDPERLNQIELRLNAIQNLKRKYGESEQEILDYAVRAREEMDALTHQEQRSDDLNLQLKKQIAEMKQTAISLHQARKSIAKKLSTAIDQQLQDLYMEHAHFKVNFEETKSFTKDGKDNVVFYLSANQGEPFKPLHKIASGGEMSRIMLAIKTIFQMAKGGTAIIFDEVDTGVSGRVAKAMAHKMYLISKESQVLCISHLSQVAAMADYQLLITKVTTNNRTATQIEQLSDEQRVTQLARMQSGENVTDVSRVAAKEQLKQAAEERQQLKG
ncbi:MAG: DNA repair protein RecN [Aerococcus sp.]|nr:DNA repair protein RecN [Aerococcus sp.]